MKKGDKPQVFGFMVSTEKDLVNPKILFLHQKGRMTFRVLEKQVSQKIWCGKNPTLNHASVSQNY